LFKGYGAKVGLGNMRVKAENRMVTDKKLIIREKQHSQPLYITLFAIHIYPLFFHREVRLPILLLSFSLF
jgi:hypothetical protein